MRRSGVALLIRSTLCVPRASTAPNRRAPRPPPAPPALHEIARLPAGGTRSRGRAEAAAVNALEAHLAGEAAPLGEPGRAKRKGSGRTRRARPPRATPAARARALPYVPRKPRLPSSVAMRSRAGSRRSRPKMSASCAPQRERTSPSLIRRSARDRGGPARGRPRRAPPGAKYPRGRACRAAQVNPPRRRHAAAISRRAPADHPRSRAPHRRVRRGGTPPHPNGRRKRGSRPRPRARRFRYCRGDVGGNRRNSSSREKTAGSAGADARDGEARRSESFAARFSSSAMEKTDDPSLLPPGVPRWSRDAPGGSPRARPRAGTRAGGVRGRGPRPAPFAESPATGTSSGT